MGLAINGSTVDVVKFNDNGTEYTVDTILWVDGSNAAVEVYSSTPPQTDAPSISAGIYLFNQWEIQVTNNDATAATIRAEENDSTPDISRGTVASGSAVSVFSSQPSFATFTMYATAQVTGESLSNVVSRTIT